MRIEDLNPRAKSINLLEENVGVNICELGFRKGFLDMTPPTKGKHRK